MFRQQQTIAENVARHIPDADAGKAFGLNVLTQFAEVTFDRLPRAARGDTHALVVIADTTTRGKSIIKPEAIAAGNAIRDIREFRRAFIRCNNQIEIVAVVTHNIFRRGDFAVRTIIRDIQQALHHDRIAGDAFCLEFIRFAGRTFDDKSALRSHRNDDAVLDHLSLHQAQNFIAKILATI